MIMSPHGRTYASLAAVIVRQEHSNEKDCFADFGYGFLFELD